MYMLSRVVERHVFEAMQTQESNPSSYSMCTRWADDNWQASSAAD